MAYPNLRQAIWLSVLYLLIEAGMGFLIYIAGLNSHQPLADNNFVLGVAKLAGLLLILAYVSRRTDRCWLSYLQPGMASFDWRIWPSVTISIVGVAMVLLEMNKAVVCVIPIPESVQDLVRSTLGRETTLESALFHSALVAPYIEEVFYRGIVLSGLLSIYTSKRAIFWSSILFGVSHLNPWQLAPTLIYGVGFAWWTIRTGSLWPALFGHALNNLLFTMCMHIEIPYCAVPDDLNVVVFNPWWWVLTGAVTAVLGLRWFYQISKGTKSSNTVESVAPETG